MDPLAAKTIAAATGATLTVLTMTPFDVVKTRLQTQPPPPPAPLFVHPPTPSKCCQPTGAPCVRSMSTYARPLLENELVCVWDHGHMRAERVNGFGDALLKVWRIEGVRGLWKGVGTSFVISVPSATFYMLTYDHLLRSVLPSLSFIPPAVTPMIAGVTARTFITSAVSPLELLRTNLQSTPVSPSNPHTLRSVLRSVRSLVAERGASSLWRGLGPTLWRDVPFSGIYWATYEKLKKELLDRGFTGAKVSFACGVTAGSTAAIVTSPFDVLKTRRQALLMSSAMTASSGGVRPPSATFPLLAQIVRTEGVAALYAGLTPRMAKIAPACGIMIACYDGVGGFLSRKN
ncbi:mitochondrial carrier [Exidia glandulosa HHB12029]|uniref:Mitochondrial carrier n=1 Tax=Exidia glandulosa HHB12029 TaxID=1314781 RepID=A0A165PDH4_EXIGL|nr:mitochondrial carrier [Exidia glandulosa HHB12029]